jgi:hypothetical protein
MDDASVICDRGDEDARLFAMGRRDPACDQAFRDIWGLWRRA